LYHLLVLSGRPSRFGRRRGDAGFLLDVLYHVEQHLGGAQIRAGGFVDQLGDHRLALGDLAAFPVDRDEDRLIQRVGQERRQVLGASAAGVAGLALLETVCSGGRPGPTL